MFRATSHCKPSPLVSVKRKPAVPVPAPAIIEGLTLWFKADSITGLNDGDAVATWPDSSELGRNATQATGANRPTFKTNILNGRPIVRFDGTSDFLATASILGSTLFGPSAMTVFVVQKQLASDNLNTPFRWVGNGGASHVVGLHATIADILYWDAGSNSMARLSVAQPSGWDDSWRVVTCLRSVGFMEIRVGGVAIATTGAAVGTTFTGETSPFYIGGIGDANSHGGDIAEIIFFNRALTTDERQTVESYLAGKYAL